MGPKHRASKPFVDPTSISGLQTWYDSSDLASITKDGSNLVSSWANKGSTVYPVASTTTARPTYIADDGDGKPCLSFTSANYLRNLNSLTNDEDTGFIVVYVDGVDADPGGIFGRGTNLVNTGSSQLNWSIAGSSDGASALRMGPPLKRGKYIVLSCRRSAAYQMYYGGASNTGIIEVRENGATVKKTTHTSTTVSGGIFISNAGTGPVMKVREQCWFSRCLTDDEMLLIENYLNNKWNSYPNFAGRRDYHPGLQRWFTNTGNTAPAATYPVFAIMGQSNGKGRGDVASLPTAIDTSHPITGAYMWWNNGTTDVWDVLQAGVNTNALNNTQYHGIELSFMKCFVTDFGMAYMVKSNTDGTDLKTRWIPTGDKTSNLWRGAVDVMWSAMYKAGYDSGIHLVPTALLWFQGEADGGFDSSYYDSYQANEQAFLNACRAKIVNAANMKMISIHVNSSTYPVGYQTVNAAKTANSFAMANYATPVARWGQGSYPGEGAIDSVHANSQGLIRIGNDCALRMGCTTQVTP